MKSKIYGVSDLHCGHPDCDSEALAQFIDVIEPESTVWCVGDTWELLLASEPYIAFESQGFGMMCMAREEKGINWHCVEGNHDPIEKQHYIKTFYSPVAFGNVKSHILMLHGHQFDFIWDERHEQWLWWKLKKLLRIASETPWAEKMANKEDRYVNHIGMIHARAIRWLQHSLYQQLLIGHTHCPITHRLPDGRKVIDLGDLTLGSRTYAELVDGKFVLKTLERSG